MQDRLFTIGYAGFSSSSFFDLLQERKIKCIVDVRSMPWSKRFLDFSQSRLQSLAKARGVSCLHFGAEFGARQTDPQWLLESGYLDFARFVRSPQFQQGCRRIGEGLRLGWRIVLLCAEKEPRECHRGVMIGRWFAEHDVMPVHLTPEGDKSQDDVAAELLAIHFKDEFALRGRKLEDRKRMARSMGVIPSLTERVAQAYVLQNEAMGRRAARMRLERGEGAPEGQSPAP